MIEVCACIFPAPPSCSVSHCACDSSASWSHAPCGCWWVRTPEPQPIGLVHPPVLPVPNRGLQALQAAGVQGGLKEALFPGWSGEQAHSVLVQRYTSGRGEFSGGHQQYSVLWRSAQPLQARGVGGGTEITPPPPPPHCFIQYETHKWG